MCGISAFIKGTAPTDKNTVSEATSMIQRLVYRGYDSWGYATSNGKTHKKVGEVPKNIENFEKDVEACISHTRWATHGGVTQENAHPHTSSNDRFAVVHNGIIENHGELKEQYNGHTYTSETDTEVIPHFIEEKVGQGKTPQEAIQIFDKQAKGNYAIVVLDRENKELYGLKRGSPLVFALPETDNGAKGAYFASDLYAISDKCEEAYFMEDGDLIHTNGCSVFHQDEKLDKQSFEWTEEEPELGNNRYWMEKEIKEIPDALNRLEESLENEQRKDFQKFKSRIEDDYKKIVFTASGTSYHAALLGAYYFQQNGINAQALIASEFDNYQHVDRHTLVIALSQSGETRDVLDAMNSAKDSGAKTASIVNVPHSTIQRKSDFSLEIKAQQENCVAATKTFTNQVYTLMRLAGKNTEQVIQQVKESIQPGNLLALEDANEFFQQNHKDIYIIGTSESYPLAREIALKLKEIPYIHAEGMMAGELKHGTLALIEEGTPVITLETGSGNLESTVEEVEARGARTKKINSENVFNPVIYGFFLAMHWAHMKNLPVDRPRNLAKTLTVK